MTDKKLDKLRAELDQWRARLDHLRVQANLGGKEARDKLDELGERLEPAWEKSKTVIEGLVSSGAGEARTLGKSLLAGWEELLRKHAELVKEAKRERAERG